MNLKINPARPAKFLRTRDFPAKAAAFHPWALLAMLICALAPAAFASPITAETAKLAAANWMTQVTGTTFTAHVVKSTAKSSVKTDAAAYYMVNLQPQGFAVVSGDDSVQPVLFYSETGQLSDNTPPDMLWMLGQCAKAIEYAQTNKSTATVETAALWSKLKSTTLKADSKTALRSASKAVSPLTTVTWDQGKYYNALCPSDSKGDDGHVYVGCVAVAIGQIMAYHQWPATGTGSHTDTYKNYGTLTVNFGNSTYNWSSMPASLSAYNTAVATILYHCGVAVDMYYSYDGSSAYDDDAVTALKTYFKYNASSVAWRTDYTDANWLTMMRNDLDAKRPIYYGASDTSGAGGHAFVIDGYQNTNYFHVNWGWGGADNGYFYITAMNVESYKFNSEQSAIFNIYPAVSGTIAGTVTSTSGAAISGATVKVTWDGSVYSYTTSSSGAWGPLSVTKAGTASITVSATGYVSTTISATVTNSGGAVTANASLSPSPASLTVSLSPSAAVTAGAQWRRSGTTTWYASGATETGITPGSYTVECKSATGWLTPSAQSVTLGNGGSSSLSFTYTQAGSITVTLSPAAAINGGAAWRRTGTSTWQASGATETGLTAGAYAIEFNTIYGWFTPGNLSANVTLGATTSLSQTYLKQNAISPAQWQIFE